MPYRWGSVTPLRSRLRRPSPREPAIVARPLCGSGSPSRRLRFGRAHPLRPAASRLQRPLAGSALLSQPSAGTLCPLARAASATFGGIVLQAQASAWARCQTTRSSIPALAGRWWSLCHCAFIEQRVVASRVQPSSSGPPCQPYQSVRAVPGAAELQAARTSRDPCDPRKRGDWARRVASRAQRPSPTRHAKTWVASDRRPRWETLPASSQQQAPPSYSTAS